VARERRAGGVRQRDVGKTTMARCGTTSSSIRLLEAACRGRLASLPAYRNRYVDANLAFDVTGGGIVLVFDGCDSADRGATRQIIMTSPAPSATPSSSAEQNAVPIVPEIRGKRGFRRLNPATKYTVSFILIAVLAIAAEFVIHAVNTVPRDSGAIAARELTVNVLTPGERVVTTISVFRRNATDYFRATRGVLVLTDRRMVFLGLRPRDLLAPADAPPTFDEREFPLDTLVAVETGRGPAFLTKGIIVRTPNEKLRLGVPGIAWPEAEQLASVMSRRRQVAQSNSTTQESMRKAADADWKRAAAAWKKPQYYTVRRGDALGSVATQWNTTPEQLMRLNKLPNNKIRIGDTLLVRQAM
jgi:hypothetical protein